MVINLHNDVHHESGGIFSTIHGIYNIVILHNCKTKNPYFIVIDNETQGEKFSSRIMFKESKYYGRNNSKLSQQEVLALVKHLDYSGYEKQYSYWDMLIDNWNLGNKRKLKKFKRPQYENLMFLKGVKDL